jgi:hypothetical protein
MRRAAAWIGALAAMGVAAAARADGPDPPALRDTQTPAGGQPVEPRPPTQTPPTSWFVVPSLFYLPETGLGLALAGGLHFTLPRAPEPSNVHAALIYTTQNQASVDVSTHLVTGGRLVLDGSVRFSRYPDVFFGIGPTTPESAAEDFTSRYAEALLGCGFRVGPHGFRVGPQIHLRTERIVKAQAGGLIATGAVPGATGNAEMGLGVDAVLDTRDDPYQPASGRYVEGWYLLYPDGLAAGTFGRGAADYRQFVSLGHDQILATDVYFEGAHGNVPFTLLPKLGGDRFLRGFRAGRFRDNVMYVAQAEYRFPIAWRFRGAAFLGFGGVGSSVGNVFQEPVRVGGGAGLRFRITEDRVNIRVDLAWGEKAAPDVYAIILEAY